MFNYENKLFTDLLKRTLFDIELKDICIIDNAFYIHYAVDKALATLGDPQLDMLRHSQPDLANQYPDREYYSATHLTGLIKRNLAHLLVDKIYASYHAAFFGEYDELNPLREEVKNSSEFAIQSREQSDAEDRFFGNFAPEDYTS